MFTDRWAAIKDILTLRSDSSVSGEIDEVVIKFLRPTQGIRLATRGIAARSSGAFVRQGVESARSALVPALRLGGSPESVVWLFANLITFQTAAPGLSVGTEDHVLRSNVELQVIECQMLGIKIALRDNAKPCEEEVRSENWL